MSGVQVVWFKRDLRWTDHAPLSKAARLGPVVALYVVEPVVWCAPEADGAHLGFVRECAAELDAALRARGGWLVVRVGDVVEVLRSIHAQAPIAGLWSHEETGLRATWERDKAVARWCRASGVPWTELPQTGVVRRLPSRDGWARRWEDRMDRPLVQPPERIVPGAVPPAPFPDDAALAAAGIRPPPDTKPDRQRGGSSLAHEALRSFLTERGRDYTAAMSSPVEGWTACSRVSPYLAWGALSVREAHHAAVARLDALTETRGADPRWVSAVRSFEARLRWHCHFIQKLEDAPDLDTRHLHPGYEGLREPAFDEARFHAWATGTTGFPMIDATMRCLLATGWLNFRMRAMLMSFAAYDLWLHWREPGLHLARHFLDYEPGIHYSQVQMQSGTTGINTLRMYSPTRQALDQDPDGVFIRRWVPELAKVPLSRLAEPWRMTQAEELAADCRIGVDYPAPVVDHAAAVAAAKRAMYGLRARPEVRAEAQAVFQRHGSRKRR